MNKLLNKLEAKYGNYAVEGLIKYITGLMCLVFFLKSINWLSYGRICLDANAIMQGEIWRIITFAFIPVSSNAIYLIFEILILYMCADGLEKQWGSFKFTVYYFIGIIMISLSSFIIYMLNLPQIYSLIITSQASYFIYLNLFLAFAYLYPDYEILLYFILPLKVKYIAWFSIAVLGYYCLSMPILFVPFAMCLGNFLLFFGFESFDAFIRRKKQKAYDAQFEYGNFKEQGHRHKCIVCGKTEVSSPDLQFRYCTCDECGENGVCFCLKHLKEHKANKQN